MLKIFKFRSIQDYKQADLSGLDESSYDVPKIIHFIWIENPIKQKYIDNIKAFTKNTDYKIFVWTDDEIPQLNKVKQIEVKEIDSLDLQFFSWKHLDGEETIGSVTDILRLEVNN